MDRYGAFYGVLRIWVPFWTGLSERYALKFEQIPVPLFQCNSWIGKPFYWFNEVVKRHPVCLGYSLKIVNTCRTVFGWLDQANFGPILWLNFQLPNIQRVTILCPVFSPDVRLKSMRSSLSVYPSNIKSVFAHFWAKTSGFNSKNRLNCQVMPPQNRVPLLNAILVWVTKLI